LFADDLKINGVIGLAFDSKIIKRIQPKIASPINVGSAVQPTSIRFDPPDGLDRSASDPLRYLTQKKRIGKKMTAMKKREMTVKAK